MGWLCSNCGTENKTVQARCRACRKRAGMFRRVSGLFITLWECRAQRYTGRMAAIGSEDIKRYVGSANRTVGIGIWIAAALGAAAAILLCLDPSGMSRAGEQLKAVGQRLTQLGSTAVERLDGLVQDELDPTGKYTLLMIKYDLDRFTGSCSRFGAMLSELWRSGTAHLQRHIQLLGRELCRLDIHFAAWLINRLYELKGWLREIGFGGADGVIVKLCDYLAQCIEWLKSLRS